MRTTFFTFLVFITIFAQGQNQNISNGVVFDGEPYLAIDPNNSQHIVVAWMSWINIANQFKIKTKTSFDGGQTWSIATAHPHTVNTYSSPDPCLDFDSNGNVFVCYIDFDGIEPPVNGGVYIRKSTDGGLTWNAPVGVINANFDGTKWPIDRPWIVIDKSNGVNNGTIYVTSMNGNRSNYPFNPYLSVSTDGGASFSTTYLDDTNWLAGSLNPLPMASPTVSSDGVFYAAYPSYVLTQSQYPQNFIASSSDGGTTFTYNTILTNTDTIPISDFDFAKKAYLLISNPANSNHLAFIYLRTINGNLDVYLTESLNSGTTWNTPIRINDDLIGNDRMHDLIWGDFDTDGDLIITWRDRRNGTDNTYQTQSEIWASYRSKNATQFAPNFQITSQTIAYDAVLENSGNDFMSTKLQNDTLHSVWGDTRDGKLNIWFQSMSIDGTILNVQQLSSENLPDLLIYPNPTESIFTIEVENIKQVKVYNINGKRIISKQNTIGLNKMTIDLENHPSGTYLIEIITAEQKITRKIQIE
ncbi:MAG TPA: T9SS type A sorting domain-containing protein [Flavobacteriia bacterium]|nr:T9SS type A sorting domain-containing protein [Flavobacteriia bacterium]